MSITLETNDVIAFVGDSLTYNGFQSGVGNWSTSFNTQLQSKYPGQGITLLNCGVGGDDSTKVLARIGSVIALNPTVVAIWIGINDCAELEVNTPNADPCTMLRTYQSNMQSIISALLDVSTIRVIILISPFGLGECKECTNTGDTYVEPLRELTYQLSQMNVVNYIDMRASFIAWEKIENTTNAATGVLTLDGAHPNALGSSVISGALQWGFGIE